MDPGDRPLSWREQLLARMVRREDELRAQIAERRAAIERGTPPSEPQGDVADLAFARSRAEVDQELIDHDLLEIDRIERARERLSTGSYGTCIECGSEIGAARLEVNPAALRCAACQELHEKTLGRSARALR